MKPNCQNGHSGIFLPNIPLESATSSFLACIFTSGLRKIARCLVA
jgi:hypothetical protein